MIKVSLAGASGYSGAELVRLLKRHPSVELVHLAAGTQSGKSMASVFPSFEGVLDHTLVETDWQRLGRDSDVVFLALPHGLGLEAVPILLAEDARVIDIGADFRLKDPSEYQRWYGLEHSQTALLEQAVYGLPELHRSAIGDARLVANPGCYPTASVLALLPVLEALGETADSSIVVDAKSGTSGAGRAASVGTLFCEVNENVKPYKVADHRHGPEMEQTLAAVGPRPNIFFTPHLMPMTRGILSACYVRSSEARSDPELEESLYRALDRRYAAEPFVRVLRELPQTKATYGSNYCDVAVRVDARSGVVCAFGALDNLVKGAAGQAVQNMNLMFGLEETSGLELVPLYP